MSTLSWLPASLFLDLPNFVFICIDLFIQSWGLNPGHHTLQASTGLHPHVMLEHFSSQPIPENIVRSSQLSEKNISKESAQKTFRIDPLGRTPRIPSASSWLNLSSIHFTEQRFYSLRLSGLHHFVACCAPKHAAQIADRVSAH